jgi:branched-chain amino acid transport system substrate-binding protein
MRRPIIAGICVLALAVTACSSNSNSSASSSKDYKILVIGATSGPEAGYTSDYIRGIKAAAAVINKGGGIDGKTIELTVSNDQADPTTAVGIVRQALTSNRPDLLYCLCADEELALAPIVTQAKLLMLTTALDNTVTNATKYPYIFSQSYQTPAPYTAIKDRLVSEGAKRVGVLTINNNFGQEVWSTLQSLFAGTGVQLFDQSINLTALSATSNLEALKQDHVDHLIVSSYTSVTSYIFAARVAAGMSGVPAIGDQAVAATNPNQSIAPADRQNVTLLTTQVQLAGSISGPAWDTMLAALKPYGALATGMQQPAETYTGMQLIAAAAKQAGSTSVEAMSKALNDLRPDTNSAFFYPTAWIIKGTLHMPVFPESDFRFINIAPYDSQGQFPASAAVSP